MTVGSHDLSQVEKRMTVISKWANSQNDTQNCPAWRNLSFRVKIVVILWICSALQTIISFPAWDELRDAIDNSQKLEVIGLS